MERTTSKTMDCFVEFVSADAAINTVNHLNSYRKKRTVGERFVKISVSSQEELMRNLFPKAKYVQWAGQNPIILPSTDHFSSGFQGFVQSEELVSLVKVGQRPKSVSSIWHDSSSYC